MKHFKALRIDRPGARAAIQRLTADSLWQGEGPLIRVHYSSLNYKDALAITARGAIARRFPLTAGIDLAGEVVEPGGCSLRVGAPVLATGYELGVAHDGGYAEYARVPAQWVLPLPEGLSPRDAMALGTAGLTAALCLHRLEQNGQIPGQGPVVVTGATGGVGSVAVRALIQRGYEVVAVTGKAGQVDWLRTLGARQVLLRQELDYAGDRPLESGQWGGAIDNLGGAMLAWLLRSTRPWGNVVAVGLAEGSDVATSVMPFILRGVSLLGVSSANCPPALRRALWQGLAQTRGMLGCEPADLLSETVSLEDLGSRAEDMLLGKTRGRILVRLRPA